MGTSLCSASPVSEPNLPPDSTNQPIFLLPNLIRHPTELFSFNFLSQKNIQNLRSKMASRCRQNYHEECEAAINRPAADEWETPLAAMEYVLKLEKEVNQALLEIHALASTHNDPHLTKFLEDNYLEEQAESIHKIAGYITQLHRVGDGLGVHLFDKDLQ